MAALSRVRLVHGAGLVGRSEFTIWWAAGEELLEALSALSHSDGSGFQSLADAILNLDFNIGGVAAVDLRSGIAFVSGNAVLVSDDAVFDGSTTGTWIEQRLPDPEGFAVNATTATTDDSTDLVAGVVRGGGFVFGEPELSNELPNTEQESIAAAVGEPSLTNSGNETIIFAAVGSTEATELLEEEDLQACSTESGIVASVEFDDGRQLEVRTGLTVGRNPTGEAIPAGYDSVTVLDEFVSRRHWQLDIGASACELRDLGSATGTTVESGGETQTLEAGEAVELGTASRVLFADHWVTIELHQR